MGNLISKTGQKTLIGALEMHLQAFMFEAVTTTWSKLILMDAPGIVAPVVLTGRYRSNWVIGVGAPNTATPSSGGSPGAPSAPPGPPVLPALNIGEVVYLTNSLPYAGRLEAGHSKKAPQGVVGPVVADLSTDLDGIVALINAGNLHP